jgi:hypothetical protein
MLNLVDMFDGRTPTGLITFLISEEMEKFEVKIMALFKRAGVELTFVFGFSVSLSVPGPPSSISLCSTYLTHAK